MFSRLICVCALVSAACASRTELRPAETALPISGGGAEASAANVRLVVRADAWDGELVRHFDDIIPMQVTIENDGAVPLAIRYQHFQLMTGEGGSSAALPPFDIDGTQTVPFERIDRWAGYPYPLSNFALAPYLARYYPGLVPFDGDFVYDRRYYGRYYPRWVRVQLPTPEMLRRALPEGVLRSDGSMTGFLYFDRPGEVRSATLTFELVNALDDRGIGTIEIPFVGREDEG
jgi:hypothetical protein